MTSDFPKLGAGSLARELLGRLERDPHGIASVMVHPGQPDRVYSISDLLRLADRYAQLYREAARASERMQVAVCLHHGIHLHAAFVGGLLSGMVPTMIAPPSPRMERAKYVRSFVRMLDHIRPEAVVTEPEILDELAGLDIDHPQGAQLFMPSHVDGKLELGPMDASRIEVADAQPEDVAFIQHSSGTTGLQKGIALSHGAVREQIERYGRIMALRPDDRIATWLPLYHDMGFIACFVMPLVTGIPIIEISPFDWVGYPALLLHKIAEHRATLCWLPNFAFSYLARSVRASHLRGLDLGSVRAFVNCSEPVMAKSFAEFAERFADCGVQPERLVACYAMAENVFAVSQSLLGHEPRVDRISARRMADAREAVPADGDAAALELVSNGPPVPGVELRVVDPDGAILPDRVLGEVCIRGPSLFSGYYLRDDLSSEAIVDGWFRTGDLGYLAEGELYIAGRSKDLIIIQGRNFHPSDIEAVVSDVDGVIDGRVVAFGERDEASGTERLVILAETGLEDTSELGRLQLEVRNRVAQQLDCTPGRVQLLPARWLVKSTAGKIARADNRAKYEAEFGR